MTHGILCQRISKTMGKFLLNRLTTVGATTRKQWPRPSRVSSCRKVLERQQASRFSAHGGKCAPKIRLIPRGLVTPGLTHDGQTNVTMMGHTTHGSRGWSIFHATIPRGAGIFRTTTHLKKIEGKWGKVATSRAPARLALDAFLCSEYDQISGLCHEQNFIFRADKLKCKK